MADNSTYKMKDEELFKEIEKLKNNVSGDPNRLYELSEKYIYKLIYDVVKDRETADEIQQNVYLKIYNSIGSLGDARDFYAWAGRIATNQTLRFLQEKRKISAESDHAGGQAFSYRIAQDDNELFIPESILADRERQRILAQTLDALSPEQKLCMQYFYYEGMSVREIAQAFGCPEETVRDRLNCARSKVKTVVDDMSRDPDVKLYSLAAMPLFFIVFRNVLEGAVMLGAAGAGAAGAAGGVAVQALGAGTAKAAGGSAASATAGSVAAGGTAGAAGGSAASAAAGSAAAGGTAGVAAATTAAAATGTGIGVKVAAVLVTVSLLGGAGAYVHNRAEAQRQEEIRIEQEQLARQQAEQIQFDRIKGQYGELVETYEFLTGSTDETGKQVIIDHFSGLSEEEIDIYALINEMGQNYELMKKGYKNCLSEEQYDVAQEIMFDSFDSIMGTQMLTAEMLIDMDRYYGDREAMKIYLSKFKTVVKGMSDLTATGTAVLDHPTSAEIMKNYSTEDVAAYLSQGINLPNMIVMYANEHPSAEYNELAETVNQHISVTETYMEEMNDYFTYATEDEELMTILSDYQTNHPTIADAYYQALQKALGEEQ